MAIGSNEFAASGLLHTVAAESRTPGHDLASAAASASVFVWGYALGVVIGAVVLGPLSLRFRARGFSLCCLAARAR